MTRVAITILLTTVALIATCAGAADAATCASRAVPVSVAGAPLHMSGSYCRPDGSPRGLFVLVPGSTYNRAYWDFPYQPATYSFARAANAAGYATFALDRLGTGASSKPPSATLTALAQAAAVHQVIAYARSTGFDGRRYENVLLGGHSLGSMIAVLEAGTYRDVDGVLVTGMTHAFDLSGTVESSSLFYPAILDPAFAGTTLDPGYVTTRPGTRGAAFYATDQADPAVIAADEATKDVVTLTEAADGLVVGALLPYSNRITAPVLVVVGERDKGFCGSLGGVDCSSDATLRAHEAPSYSNAPCFDAVVMPGIGHDVNLHRSAPQFQAHAIRWADGASAC